MKTQSPRHLIGRLKHYLLSILNYFNGVRRYLVDWSKDKIVYESLADIGRHALPSEYPIYRRPLIDGYFLNIGYFYRLQLLRAAVGSIGKDELAFTGEHNKYYCRRVLKTLGIQQSVSLNSSYSERISRKEAKKILLYVSSADDLMTITLPYSLPPSLFYDVLLKKQRLSSVNIADPFLEDYLTDYLTVIRKANAVLASHRPDVVVLSHAVGMFCSPVAWLAAQRKIPVIVLHGNYGVPRFWKINEPRDVFFGLDRPLKTDLDRLSHEKQIKLRRVGRKYLNRRFNGETTDLGGRFAFRNRSESASLQMASEDKRPIVVVYASNWFDFPHALGMSHFRDFEDWILATYERAMCAPNIRWLFRPHPCDQWYGGISLKDILPLDMPEHISLISANFPGHELIQLASAAITYHGTVAIEYAAKGKPVLVPDTGWYDTCGFALRAVSRSHYLALLGTVWFAQIETRVIKSSAELFSGMFFCTPSWQNQLVLPDDSDNLGLTNFFKRKDFAFSELQLQIKKEIMTISNWINSSSKGYHTYKNAVADTYVLSNVTSQPTN